MSTITISETEMKAAKRASWAVARKWKTVDQEEVYSELLLWLVEKYPHVVRYRDEEFGAAKLAKALYRRGTELAVKETEAVEGHRLQDANARYSKRQIEAVLPYIWDTEAWPQSEPRVDPRNGRVISDLNTERIGEATAMLIDVSGCVSRLSEPDQEFLRLRFRDDLAVKDLAERYQVEPDTITRRKWQLVDKLHIMLGEPLR